MDVIFGAVLAVVLLVLCLGFGLAVSTAVTRLLRGRNGDDCEPPDRR